VFVDGWGAFPVGKSSTPTPKFYPPPSSQKTPYPLTQFAENLCDDILIWCVSPW